MKSIFIFFFIMFVGLGAGVYFYETQIASPNAADALTKVKKKTKAPAKPNIVKKSSSVPSKFTGTMTKPEKSPRIVELFDREARGRAAKKYLKKQREIETLMRKSIKQSVTSEIQKAVVAEISKKR